MLGSELLEQQFMHVIAKRVQQAARPRLDAVYHQATDNLQRFVGIEWRNDPAGIVQPLVYFAPQETRDERFGVLQGNIVDVVTSLATDLQGITEAFGGNESG